MDGQTTGNTRSSSQEERHFILLADNSIPAGWKAVGDRGSPHHLADNPRSPPLPRFLFAAYGADVS